MFQAPSLQTARVLLGSSQLSIATASFLVLQLIAVTSGAAPLEWTFQRIERVGTNPPVQFVDAAYGNGKYVVIGQSGELFSATSEEPYRWVSGGNIAGVRINRMIFARGMFVAVGLELSTTNTLVLTSIIGQSWTRKELPEIRGLGDITYGNGQFVAIGWDIVARSSDAVTWTINSHFVREPPLYLNSVSFLNGQFLVVFSEPYPGPGPLVRQTKIAISENLINWEELDPVVTIGNISFGRELYVGLTDTDCSPCGTIVVSTDAQTWRNQPPPAPIDGYSTAYGNGVFVVAAAGHSDSFLLNSNDDLTWEEFAFDQTNRLWKVTFANNRFVAVGSGLIAVSEDFRPLISNPQWNQSSVGFDFDAREGTMWEIQSSIDLSQWTTLGRIQGTADGRQTFTSPVDRTQVRFIRARKL